MTTQNPFNIVKAEEFNHGLEQLASLMHFREGLAGTLLSGSNVFLDGSRGSGKSMYLRLLSHPAKAVYERLVGRGAVEPLPQHKAYLGVYVKLAPTLFGPHEYERKRGFTDAFQEFFNVYAMECMIRTIRECDELGFCDVDREGAWVRQLATASGIKGDSLGELWNGLRVERRRLRQQLNELPYAASVRAQPDILWDFAEIVSGQAPFTHQRVHLLVDEYDNLSEYQQRVLNTYLRRRDFPVTFKIACRKHRLVTHDINDRPLNQSGDFTRVALDDERLGLGEDFASYVESIANKRLRNAGIDRSIRDFLGKTTVRRPKPRSERQYAGYAQLVVLSSGIVRTFLELCRDIYATASEVTSWPVAEAVQDGVVKGYAADRWSSLSTDKSARPELQRLVEQVAKLFKRKSEGGKEKQMIRLEIIDFEQATRFLRELLDAALDYEAFIKPNRERVQKNSGLPSTGYLLHRVLCVHFRLEPESRWDFEINSVNLERLIVQPDEFTKDIVVHPTRRRRKSHPGTTAPLLEPHCPILDAPCDRRQPQAARGFLSCRLPEAGPIRDAIKLIKQTFESMEAPTRYRIMTAEDYPPSGDISCKICAAVAQSAFVLVELSKFSPSVAMELGFCVARGVPTYVLFNREEQPAVDEPFSSIEYHSYSITPTSVQNLVERSIVPFLGAGQGRRTIELGPAPSEVATSDQEVFVAMPDEVYYQETVLPAVTGVLSGAGLKAVTARRGRALQELERAARAIANAKYCIIDTTLHNPVRAMYLGMALGYGKRFVNAVNLSAGGDASVFTNARSKSVFEYRDASELAAGVRSFLDRVEGGT